MTDTKFLNSVDVGTGSRNPDHLMTEPDSVGELGAQKEVKRHVASG